MLRASGGFSEAGGGILGQPNVFPSPRGRRVKKAFKPGKRSSQARAGRGTSRPTVKVANTRFQRTIVNKATVLSCKLNKSSVQFSTVRSELSFSSM